jgi:hypothetical protein
MTLMGLPVFLWQNMELYIYDFSASVILMLSQVGPTMTESTLVINTLTNPDSPDGKQHCLELTVPGGHTSLFWAGRGWKYTMPPWMNGACNRTKYTITNKMIDDLDGFAGVSLAEYGIVSLLFVWDQYLFSLRLAPPMKLAPARILCSCTAIMGTSTACNLLFPAGPRLLFGQRTDTSTHLSRGNKALVTARSVSFCCDGCS